MDTLLKLLIRRIAGEDVSAEVAQYEADQLQQAQEDQAIERMHSE